MKMKRLAGIVLGMTIVFSNSALANDFIVDDDGQQCPGAPFVTIQSAVVAASVFPGTQQIRVCPGSYPENVTIGPDADTTYMIFGDGADKVFVLGTGTPGPI